MDDKDLMIVELEVEVNRLQDLLDRRPAMNEGLFEAYSVWTAEVYASDISFITEGETAH
jgi:hypothetical protein